MKHSYSQYLNRLEEEAKRIRALVQYQVPSTPTPTPTKPWDGVKNSQLRGLIQPAPDATASNQTARASLHAATTDELRTEGKAIKHRNNPHE